MIPVKEHRALTETSGRAWTAGNAGAAKARVLVVEDDAILRRLIADALALEGIEAATASTPTQALELCADGGPFTLVLLDWILGGATGRDFVARYVTLPEPRAPIVLVTGAGHELDLVEEIGARGFLKKPFALEELVEVVQRFAPPDVSDQKSPAFDS